MEINETGVITELNIYPVKSLRGIKLKESILTATGLKWDRFWMVVNDDGLFMSQRNLPAMASISTRLTQESLILSHKDYPDLHISLAYSGTTETHARVWKNDCMVLDEGTQVSDWLTGVLGTFRGQTLHLVRMAPNFQRHVSENHTTGQHQTHFADGYPFLITNESSLSDLNQTLKAHSYKPTTMDRFRSNIVVAGVGAFTECHFAYCRLPHGGVLHLCKPCERCKMITIDQETGETNKPDGSIKTLASMEHVAKTGAYFGQNAVLLTNASNQPQVASIRVGDTVMFCESVTELEP